MTQILIDKLMLMLMRHTLIFYRYGAGATNRFSRNDSGGDIRRPPERLRSQRDDVLVGVGFGDRECDPYQNEAKISR